MNSVKVSLDSKGYKSKPIGGEVGIINNRICKNDRVVALEEIEDFKSFAEYVGRQGVTFCPATFHNEIRNVENFKEMQLLVLDFESGISLKDVVDRTKKYNIPMLMAYETLTEGENRFRVLFKNNTSIDDKKLAKITLSSLLTMFPEADHKCNDISKMFFGGKKLLYFDKSLPTVDPESILRNMTYYLKKSKGYQHYKEYVKNFAKKHGIRLNKNGLLDISMVEETTEVTGTNNNGKNLPNSILLYKTNGKNFPNSYYRLHLDDGCTKSSVDEKHHKKRKTERSDLLPELSNCCQLFREFETGEKWLEHDELFGLSTNIIHAESGIDIFKKILAKYPDYYDTTKQQQFDYKCE